MRPTHAENSEDNRANAIKPYRYKPGQSGNPGGRPKRDVAADVADEIFTETRADIKIAYKKAIKKGDSRVFTALADRAYGKPMQKVELSGGINATYDVGSLAELLTNAGEIAAQEAKPVNRRRPADRRRGRAAVSNASTRR